MIRNEILKLVEDIKPYDAEEVEHVLDAIAWIESGAEIFRIAKPDVPPKHLVSYFLLVDVKKRKVLLLDHVKSGLWLPSGGHVEKDEHPNDAVEREIKEELNMPAEFLSKTPFFLTQMVTVKTTKEHTDVCLWYVLKGDSEKEIAFDPEEFYGYEWMSFAEVLTMNIEKLDIHMHRFMKKLIESDLVKK